MFQSKRHIGFLTAAAIFVGFAMSTAARAENVIVLGQRDAKVTIAQYTTLPCEECKRFHIVVLPKIREKYIDTGKVRFELHLIPLDPLTTVAAMIVNCAEGGDKLAFIDNLFGLFGSREKWALPQGDLKSSFLEAAVKAGYSHQAVESCSADHKIQRSVSDGLQSEMKRGPYRGGRLPQVYIDRKQLIPRKGKWMPDDFEGALSAANGTMNPPSVASELVIAPPPPPAPKRPMMTVHTSRWVGEWGGPYALYDVEMDVVFNDQGAVGGEFKRKLKSTMDPNKKPGTEEVGIIDGGFFKDEGRANLRLMSKTGQNQNQLNIRVSGDKSTFEGYSNIGNIKGQVTFGDDKQIPVTKPQK
jgi:hypothetical protein